MTWEEGQEMTPEQEEARRIEEFGLYAGADMDVNKAEKTVEFTIRDVFHKRDSITYRTDVAKGAALMFNDVADALSAASKKVKPFGK